LICHWHLKLLFNFSFELGYGVVASDFNLFDDLSFVAPDFELKVEAFGD
jgi:hypothetical protein